MKLEDNHSLGDTAEAHSDDAAARAAKKEEKRRRKEKKQKLREELEKERDIRIEATAQKIVDVIIPPTKGEPAQTSSPSSTPKGRAPAASSPVTPHSSTSAAASPKPEEHVSWEPAPFTDEILRGVYESQYVSLSQVIQSLETQRRALEPFVNPEVIKQVNRKRRAPAVAHTAGEPKRKRLNGFQLFWQEMRSAEGGRKTPMKEAGSAWKVLTKDQQIEYHNKAKLENDKAAMATEVDKVEV